MADEIDDGGPAFPRAGFEYDDGQLGKGKQVDIPQDGLSVRAYFAAKAPLMTDQWWNDSKPKDHWLEANAAWCVAHADALFAALKK